MTAAAEPKKKVFRAPSFETYTEARVEIDPSELEEAGWVYVGMDDEEVISNESLRDLITEFHNEEHQGPFRWCQHRLCAAVGRVE